MDARQKQGLSHIDVTYPNHYIDIFDRMASSPHAQGVPPVPTLPEADADLGAMIDRLTLMTQEPRAALAQVQELQQAKLDQFRRHDRMRREREGGK